MCRSIKTLYNFAPPATDEEVRAAALQFVRKLSGMRQPSAANQAVFDASVDAITALSVALLAGLETHQPPKDRDAEAAKARSKWVAREERQRARILAGE